MVVSAFSLITVVTGPPILHQVYAILHQRRLSVNRESNLLAASDRLSILGLKIPYVRRGLSD
uniref:Uncharacterized protein n=1 Tax=Solanum tuberosum TaxID=4113 RepID=M1CGE5_SOLTU